MAFLGLFPTAFAASTTATLNAGGKRVSSLSYVIDGSLGSLGGISTASTPQVIVRHGYAGQLYEVQSLTLNASSTSVNETATTQLGIRAILDDSTFLSPAATSVTWSVVSGPIASINANGLATTANVYQDTAATVRADYQAKFSTLALTVRNVGNDDFGIYAHDGIDDTWQVRYFGINNVNAAANSDPDHDGVDNYHEYFADTNPTNGLSYFHIQSTTNTGSLKIYFQSSAGRKYSLYATTNLVSGTWTSVTSQTNISGSGGVDVLTDPAPSSSPRFYRIGVSLP